MQIQKLLLRLTSLWQQTSGFFPSSWLKFGESRTSVVVSLDPISVCNFPLSDLSYWSYFYCPRKDAGWKPSFNTVYNGLPKQRQAGWVHAVSVNGPELLYKCQTRSRPAEILLSCHILTFLTNRYQQILHRNLVYLATIADSNQNMQSLLPAVSTHTRSRVKTDILQRIISAYWCS